MKMDTVSKADSNDSDSEVSMRPWTEEKEDEVIYNVYLKKTDQLNSLQTPEKNWLAVKWRTVKSRTIKAATVEKLVEHLPTVIEEMDSLYLHTFFNTYLTFTNLQYVLKLLMHRYYEACHIPGSQRENLKRNIRSVIVTWLEENPKDFYQPPDHPCLQFLKDVAMETMQDAEFLNKIDQIFQKFSLEEDEDNHYLHDPLSANVSIDDTVGFMLQGGITYRHITEIDTKALASQLTAMDAELFMRVNPQHCIGSIWSRRDKKSCDVDTYSVRATINQFNEVLNRVMSTVLWDKSLSPSSRAKIICKWIAVAQACRELKNFSSLKAIISGLQSHPVHRLQKTWDFVPRHTMQLFQDLAKIFHDDNNFEAWREILMKEGTAKFAPVILSNNGKWTLKAFKRRSVEKSLSKEDTTNIMYGTVPYLGTFLTDLDMVDKANPDFIQGLVNFEKRRKEFEVIAQIQLLQGTAKTYNIKPDPEIKEWFQNQLIVSYQEYCILSEEIEQPSRIPQSAPSSFSKDDSRPKIFRKFFSFTAEDYKQRSQKSESLKSRLWIFRGKGHGKSSSVSSSVSSNSSTDTTPNSDDSISVSSAESPISFTPINKDKKRVLNSLKSSQSLSCLSQLDQTTPVSCQYEFPSESCRIIRVTLDSGDEVYNKDGNIYKSIVITHQDRAPTIIQTALSKHNVPPNVSCKDYSMVQILPAGGALRIPDNANVFYAMNASADPYFILTRKADGETASPASPPSLRSKKTRRDSTRMSWVWVSSTP
ncbi:ral guanine nucleotide dissociation stimulator-like 1 isoform X2 [Apostichopus japonicus]|uniref:ral guanine nucleotide dissociation stimulator-like 1 isoform X2 n=1 Tax=Stichopus japonicus TaxID=307972 RepID=UPI003AB8F81A